MFSCSRKFITRYMYALSIKKALKRFGWIFLFSYTLWIYITSDIKELHTGDKRQSAKNYDIDTPSFARANRARAHHNTRFEKNAERSRRSQRFREPKDAEMEAKDFHLRHGHKAPLLQKMLKSFGQEFGRHVNDPDFKEKHDFREYQTPKYLKNFKNPCLFKNATLGRYTRSRGVVQFRCVPYFMIAGFPKCGTTDLWSRLKLHPEVAWLHRKEINFFNKNQYNYVPIEMAVQFYQDSFRPTEKIETCVSEKDADFHPCITGDASVDTIFDNKFWRQLPGNEGQTEPALTNAYYVHKINPNMKIIVLLREPVERLYSDYLFGASYVGYVSSPEDFHNTVVERIGNFTSCRSHRTLRACAYDMYDDWNIQTYKVRLNIGMYHIFISDWLKVFSQDNVMVVKSEDTRGPNRTQMLIKIFKFLGLTVPSRKHIEETYTSQFFMNERNKNSKRMLSKTKKLLQEFYKPFNRELEIMLPHIHY